MKVEEISTLFSKGRFGELIEQHLKEAKSMKYTTNIQERNTNADLLFYFLAACEQCGLYCDYLDVLQKYNENDPIEYTKKDKRTVVKILTFQLESLIYCLYNNYEEQLGIDYDISVKTKEVIAHLDKLVKEVGGQYTKRQIELKALYEDYLENRLPIYVVEFLYPFEPIVKNYTFNLSPCFPYISLEVKNVPRDTDCYTAFVITAYGLIKPDSFWKGPKWETREKFPPVKRSLDVVNMLLLQAVKASPGKMVMPYSIEQVSTVSMFQYRWDMSEPILRGTITGTDFCSQWIGGNAQWHQFTDEELHKLNDALIDTYNSKSFVTTFHHATNLLSAGFNTEAFLLLCACGEGLTYHWCEEIAESHGILAEYQEFSRSKISKCDLCGYYKGDKDKKPFGAIEPTLYANLTYLKDHNCITKQEQTKLNRLLSKVRNDELRNKTIHGSNYKVSKQEAECSLQALLRMQECFVEIRKSK